jgi:hypothetical protein
VNQFSSRLHVRVTREAVFFDRLDVHMARIETNNGSRAVFLAKPIQFEEQPVDENVALSPHEPAVSLTPEQAQRLMDELWHVGLRPTEGTGSAGQLAAVQKHLDDMRALVFETKPADHRSGSPSGNCA